MDENRPTRRSFLRFGIRDLLWAMVAVGIGLGWWVDHRDSRESYEELRQWTWSKIRTRHLTMTQIDFWFRFGNPDE